MEGFISLQMHLFFMEEGGNTKSRVMSLIICLFMITSISASLTQNAGQLQNIGQPTSSSSGIGGLADSPWPTFSYNTQRTGLSPYDTSTNNDQLKWRFETGSILTSPIVGSEGTIYIGYDSNTLYADVLPSQNQPPVADAGPDQSLNEGDAVDLDGSASYDPDGTIEIYEWDFESDGIYDYIESISSSPDGTFNGMTTHIYGDNGVYQVTLRVTDNTGADDTDTCIVTVNNVAPALEAITVQGATKVQEGVSEEWVAKYSEINGMDIGKDVAVDTYGNIYVTGYINGIGPPEDYATIKYDPDGNELWVAQYDGPANKWDQPRALALDPLGNVYVTGYSTGNGTSSDYTTIKYDSSGNELWVARYNGPANSVDKAKAIAIDSSENIYVTGYSAQNSNSPYNFDYATIKYDSLGNEIWVARYNGPANSEDSVQGITVDDSSGSAYVTGYSEDSGTGFDYATIKYDSNGNELWVVRYDGPEGGNDYAVDMVLDPLGNIYVTGGSIGPGGDSDYATIKYDPNGNSLWVARYNGPPAPFGPTSLYYPYCTIALDINGYIYVAGYSESVSTGKDYATLAYDSSGNLRWVRKYNGPGNHYDYAYALVTDILGNVFITGFSAGSGPAHDIATIAYDHNGNELWIARYNGPDNAVDVGYAITTDSSQNVYVVGCSWSDSTAQDITTIKYSRPIHYECDEGSPVSFTADSSDPGSDDLTFTWNWDDGTSDTVTPYYNSGVNPEYYYDPTVNQIKTPWGNYPFTPKDTVSHIYGDDGEYIITLTIEDDDGGTYTHTMTMIVNNIAPSINSITAPSGNEGSLITFTSTSTDPGSDDLTFTWNWGDGTFTTTPTHYNNGLSPDPDQSPGGTYPFIATDTAQHIYGDNGVYTITLTVVDDDGGSKVSTANVVVNNVAPTITMVIAPSGDEGSPLIFTANASDPGSDDLTFSWEFEYGPTIENPYFNDGSGPEPVYDPNTNEIKSPLGIYPFDASDSTTYIYGDDYNYTLTLTVTDDDNGVSTYSTTVTIDNVAPFITLVMIPYPAYEGSSATFQAKAEDQGSDDLTFEWNFGDSTPVVNETYYNDGSGQDPYPSPEGVYPFIATDTLDHTYGDDYNYTLILTVTDDDGLSTTFTTTVIVNNVAPTIEQLGPFTVDEGEPLIITGTAKDFGSDDLIFTWEFEQGPTITKTYHNDGSNPDPYPSPWGTYPFIASDTVDHIYGDNGEFYVMLTVTDDDDGVTTFNTTVTVNNVAPIVDALPSAVIDEGGTVTFTGHATDPGSDDLTFSWSWEYAPWGDKTTIYYNEGTSPDPFPSPSINPRNITEVASCQYGDNGVFIVTLTVTDDDGAQTSVNTTVTVNNVAPNATIESATMDVEIGLRVAGRKYNEVGMTLFEDGIPVASVTIERLPGSPNEQMAWIPITLDLTRAYSANVTYTPEDPPNIGGNPVWIYIKFENGSIEKLHHTFNVQQSKKRDSEHWNHVEPWEVDLNHHLIGHAFEITSHITDPGSDDEILTYTYGSQTVTDTYLNDPPNPDPYPSPEVNPVDISDMTTLVYEGPGTVILMVEDDDGGLGLDTLDIG